MPEMFAVFIEENSHFADETERLKLGEFADYAEALNVCRKIVDEFLTGNYKKGMTAEELFQSYTLFGEDAFIGGGGAEGSFSAWDYARKRCREICGNASDEEKLKDD